LLAFFGLAYPYFLITNLILLIYWTIRWKRTAFISGIVLIAGMGYLNDYFPVFVKKNKENNTPGGQELKILSYNVRAFNIYEWMSDPNTNKGIFNFIRSEHPDVICIQEYYSGNKSTLRPENINRIFGETPFHHVHYTIKTGNNTGYGIATFSRYPIVGRGVISFNKTNNIAIYTDIAAFGDTIRIYNNHLQSVNFRSSNYRFIDSLRLRYDERQLRELHDISLKLKLAYIKRAQQAAKVAASISHSPHPVIVCGDFNDTPVSYTYHTMSRGLNDAFVHAGHGTGNTYLGRLSFRIDYILYSDEFKAIDFEKVEARLSDHYPILSVLRK
jgi:endonuclease/exonuclease/phosphatase family metal-dependent hydrolase